MYRALRQLIEYKVSAEKNISSLGAFYVRNAATNYERNIVAYRYENIMTFRNCNIPPPPPSHSFHYFGLCVTVISYRSPERTESQVSQMDLLHIVASRSRGFGACFEKMYNGKNRHKMMQYAHIKYSFINLSIAGKNNQSVINRFD